MVPQPFFYFSFLFFFVNFDFFFVFLKASNINIESKKINDCKIYVLKVECIKNTFKNLNSFKIMLEILKKIQIYQKAFFLDFFVIFYYF